MKENEFKEMGAINTIAQGTQIEGNIHSNNDCRIDGIIKGNVISNAKIVVGRSGQIQGNISCTNIEIEGLVVAETLIAKELMSLKATARMTGNVTVGKIAIEPGAEFSGTCKMQGQKPAATPNPATAPQR